MRIFNTKSRQKEEFVPVHEGKVGIYACGPTVYDFFHIGNARPFIVFDVLRRFLEHQGFQVTFVQNFTDIDDKMIRRANQEGITVKELGDRFIEEYKKDASALGIREATVHPRATEHIGPIIALIKKMEAKGLAYCVNGDVYFDTRAFPTYGKLSGQKLDDLEAGARIDVDDVKKHPADFALWKTAKPGEPSWKSPWGEGRPGWHVECSAMSMKYLGETFDIHTGGNDLCFPHHENEVAQSEGATGKTYVNYWMHNGFINIDNEKMSKSAGNFFTVRDILKEYAAEDIRFFMLSAHYRSPVNFSRDMIAQAHTSLQRLYTARDQMLFLQLHANNTSTTQDEKEYLQKVEQFAVRFDEAMADDLNTAEAIGCLFSIVQEANTTLCETSSLSTITKTLDILMGLVDILGVLTKPAETKLPENVQKLVEERALARQNKDWTGSDALRDQLKALGYTVEDTSQGQKVRRTL